MFSLPQTSANEIVDGLPVVRLSEDVEIVRALVTMLYPIPPEIPSSYERVLALLAAAQKYDMTTVQSSIRAEIIRRGLPTAPTGAQAFGAFAIAFSNNLTPEVETTARLTLDYPLTFEALGHELRLFRGPALRELVGFRRVCKDNIISCLESFLDARNGPSKIWVGCPRSKPPSQPPPIVRLGPSSFQSQERSAGGAPRRPVRKILNNNDKYTLPPWLRDLFTQKIEELKQYFTWALIKPSSIRVSYLAALMEHSPTPNDCPTCLMVHAHKGEGYCAELEQKLTHALNQASIAFRLLRFIGV